MKNIPWAQRSPIRFMCLFSLVIVLAYQFYCATFLNPFAVKLSNTLLVIALMLYCLKGMCANIKKIPFYNIVRWLMFSAFISMVLAYLFKEQSVLLTFTYLSRSVFLLVIFFLLWEMQPLVKSLENTILVFGMLYVVLWLYAMWKTPEVTFGFQEDCDFNDQRGMIRINFVGRGNLILAYFLCLNRFREHSQWRWMLFACVFFLFIVFQLTRQLIIFPLLIGMVYLLWGKRKWCIIGIVVVTLLFSIMPRIQFQDDTVIGSMINLTEQQAESQQSGEENIRISEYRFFFTEWHDNVFTFVAGTSAPHAQSEFGKWYIDRVNNIYNYYLSDVGYASMFAVLGLWGLFLYIMLYYRAIRIRIPTSFLYTKLWFFFLIFANITASWYDKADFIMGTIICLYIMGAVRLNNKKYINEI